MKPKLGILISVLLSVFCSIAESNCSKGCDLALASYYVWEDSNLTFIAEVLQSDPDTIVSYNKQKITDKHSVQLDIRINVPFTCNCINGEYLGHLFYYTVIQGDAYMKVAETYFANLTTYESLEANNGYAATNIPVGAILTVPVTCSCGGSSVSTEYGPFITYPLRPGDTLVSLAAETGLSTTLLQSYNPGVYFSQGGLVYIPIKKNPGKESKGNPLLKIAFGISGAVAGIVVISFVIIYSLKRRHFSSNAMVCCKSGANNFQTTNEEFVKKYGSIAPKRYTYSDVKKLTNSFKEKVGQGGYGVVYKGKLLDGRMVAVKILSASKGNGEEFINEVASISRTSHVNIVTLLGFCYEKTKRALIYEFMPNRSLDKFIYDKGHPITNHHLDSNCMFQIAVGIARGLEYLHRGCNTRILHFDIKPHNILLDEDLCPKISDFGLAKLCKTKESIVSMTGMRGTAGYIAPEVFSRYFGGVSHKSDVYSYGMLVLEMVGARKEFDNELSQTSETYFPHGIYNKLEQGESFVTLGDITEEEEDNTIKKMVMVSLWCTQTSPSDRPSMGKVIEMLEGSLQSLQFPPKPVMHSPMRSPQDSSTSSQSHNPTF